MTRGMLTMDDLRERCVVDKDTGCWLWQGASAADGTPRIYTFDHERGEKRSMSGPKAAWNIAYQEAPRKGWFVFRRCVVAGCLCPVHLGQARDRKEMGEHIRLNGARKGTAVAARRANVVKAWAASGTVVTPAAVVLACRAAGPEITNVALAALHGIQHSTVSRIRRGESHRGVV